MDELITDLKSIRLFCELQNDKDWKFREFLKFHLKWSDKRLDSLVREIAEEVTEQMDCTTCANCCRTMGMTVSDADIKRLSKRLGMTAEEFESRYEVTIEDGEKHIMQTPCPFLEDCKCSVYDDRPNDCREFPHMHKTGLRSRSMSVIQNAAICPIVFNTWMRLKMEFGW